MVPRPFSSSINLRDAWHIGSLRSQDQAFQRQHGREEGPKAKVRTFRAGLTNLGKHMFRLRAESDSTVGRHSRSTARDHLQSVKSIFILSDPKPALAPETQASSPNPTQLPLYDYSIRHSSACLVSPRPVPNLSAIRLSSETIKEFSLSGTASEKIENGKRSTTSDSMQNLLLALQLKGLDCTGRVRSEVIQRHFGGCSEILVRHLDDGTLIAEKVIRYSPGSDMDHMSKRVIRELRICSKLNHAHILPLKGFIRREDSLLPSIVTEWMRNGSLQEYMKKNSINNIQVARGITTGLSYLHENHIVHGDLKAANVVISPSGVPMLMDFGVSHLLKGSIVESATKAEKGTLRWLAPELLIEGADFHTNDSDVWALGMTYLEMLTKDVPYAHLARDHAIMVALFKKQLPLTPEDLNIWGKTDRQLWKLCLCCWSIDVSSRPTAERLTEDLDVLCKAQMHMEERSSRQERKGLIAAEEDLNCIVQEMRNESKVQEGERQRRRAEAQDQREEKKERWTVEEEQARKERELTQRKNQEQHEIIKRGRQAQARRGNNKRGQTKEFEYYERQKEKEQWQREKGKSQRNKLREHLRQPEDMHKKIWESMAQPEHWQRVLELELAIPEAEEEQRRTEEQNKRRRTDDDYCHT